jgi:hypothetical protein
MARLGLGRTAPRRKGCLNLPRDTERTEKRQDEEQSPLKYLFCISVLSVPPW